MLPPKGVVPEISLGVPRDVLTLLQAERCGLFLSSFKLIQESPQYRQYPFLQKNINTPPKK